MGYIRCHAPRAKAFYSSNSHSHATLCPNNVAVLNWPTTGEVQQRAVEIIRIWKYKIPASLFLHTINATVRTSGSIGRGQTYLPRGTHYHHNHTNLSPTFLLSIIRTLETTSIFSCKQLLHGRQSPELHCAWPGECGGHGVPLDARAC
jgi:hypothetical protein